MREYIFRGKCRDEDKWVEGCLIHYGDYCCILQDEDKLHPIDVPYMNDLGCIDGYATPVIPESVGQYTGFDEWVLMDETRNAKLYEGDIVEVWGNREIYQSNWSQYDGKVKVRGVIMLKYGRWLIDFENNYNKSICKARGKEEYDREPPMTRDLYEPYFNHTSNKDEYRKRKLESREQCLRWGFDDHSYYDDIVKIGTVFENADLLEG